jgi:phycocyanobilin:ferredoxin oxidoreductase
MSLIWSTLIDIQYQFEKRFYQTGHIAQEPGLDRFSWYNNVWTGDAYRRAHIDVVDARETKGLWMMHCCVFPHFHNSGPIFGYDIIAGKNKITGFFHDFSPTVDQSNPLVQNFKNSSDRLSWKKNRQLPDWAQNIFSPGMLAVGNIRDEDELDQMKEIVLENLDIYLENISVYDNQTASSMKEQNYYCENQQKNPHTPKVMTNLGLDPEDVRVFIEECLFPRVNQL